MSGTADLAVREDTALEAHTGALAISADQVQWTTMQEAALNQLGLKNAPNGDRLVFLHVAQRTGLDPFAKQIHMIERAGKWSIQTGIDGFRVNRARAEKKAGVLGILGQAVYIDAEGNEYKRWFKPGPPVGCEITYTVRELTSAGVIETPYTSYLRFTEYAQYKADGKLTQKWSASPAHMLEKCTEADVYRKAFPQDFSGLNLDDAQAGDGSDGPPAEPVTRRRRITADAIRARGPQTVAATVVTEPSPAAPETPRSVPAADPVADVAAAGEGPITEATWREIEQRLHGLGVEQGNRVRVASQIAGKAMKHATEADGRKVADTLEGMTDGADLDGLLAELAMADDPTREEGADGE
jgi:hypothetical protein